jgi:hypothetical protein
VFISPECHRLLAGSSPVDPANFADHWIRNAERHQDRGSCVPQVVNADVLDAGCLRERAKLLAEIPAVRSLRLGAPGFWSRWEEEIVRAEGLQRFERLHDRLRDWNVTLKASLGADKDKISLPHRRRSRESEERSHLAIAVGLVPEQPKFRRRDDSIAAGRLRTLPHSRDRIPVEAPALHGEVENPVHDRAVVIHA